MANGLPVTGIITLSSKQEDWSNIILSGSKESRCVGLIDRGSDTKAKVNIVITNIIEPRSLSIKADPNVATTFDKYTSESIFKIAVFAHGYIEESTWMLFGFIDGSNRVPFIIIHYEKINLSVYTLKAKENTNPNFFPQMN